MQRDLDSAGSGLRVGLAACPVTSAPAPSVASVAARARADLDQPRATSDQIAADQALLEAVLQAELATSQLGQAASGGNADTCASARTALSEFDRWSAVAAAAAAKMALTAAVSQP
jgi:hypothetical protein